MVPSMPKSNEWSNITLGDIIIDSAFGPRFSSDLYCINGNIGTIRTTDLDLDGVINYESIPYATLPIETFKSHILKTGDLLITRSGTCGIPCLFTEQEKPIIAGAFLIRFKLKDHIEPTFLHMLLKEPSVKNKIDQMASGGVQKNLTGTNLKKLHLKIPLINEQRKIAQILSTWEKAISTTKFLIGNSQQQKKVLMQQLLTGKKRFSEFNGKWEKVRLGDITEMNSGGTPKSSVTEYYDGNISWVSIADMTKHGKWIFKTDKNISQLGLENSSARLYPVNTVLYAMYASIGECS
ncbi:MAG: hypothetical protein GQ547_09350, partial [Methylophaga sp.]|nr:hypothetical protein [Methylophaga sp.]